MPYYTVATAEKIVSLHMLHPSWNAQRIKKCFDEDDPHFRSPCINGIAAVIKRHERGEPLLGNVKQVASMTHEHAQRLKKLIDEEPRRSLCELQRMLLAAMFQYYSEKTISATISKVLKYTKKRVTYYARQRETIECMRWVQLINSPDFDAKLACFIDESHMTKAMPRLYGYGPIGEEISVPSALGGGGSYSYLAACNYQGMVGPACQLLDTKDCAVDATRFLSWFRCALLPCLGSFQARERNSILVMDNASIHHTGKHTLADGRVVPTVQALAESVGARVLFLSPYSPGYNPIEKFFANIKQQARKASLLFHTESVAVRIRDYERSISEKVSTNTFIACGLRNGFSQEVLDAHDKMEVDEEESVVGADFSVIQAAHAANLATFFPDS